MARALLLIPAVPLACSLSPELSHRDDAPVVRGEGGSKSDTDSGGDIQLGGRGEDGTGGRTGNGTPEVCDGTDNDGDGLVDNVDAGQDGICDCLVIGTLGEKGTWGQGDVFADWLDGKSTNPVVDIGTQTLTKELLAPFQILIAQNLSTRPAFSESEIEALNDWLQNGGGLMTMIGYAGSKEVANVNALIASTGLSYGTTSILSKGGIYTRPVNDVWTPHPTSEGITAIGFDTGYPVLGNGTVIAEEGGHVVAQAKEIDQGHLFLWGDEWISYNSEWTQDESAPVQYQVERFWLNIIQYLSPPKECQVPLPPHIPK